ncbi:Leucine-rich repeat-containing protein 56 [Tritrichomonas musculus]|uniref:Leucine-rich repeat-containing protein 56 n=1 Tax=Tritrichomonas musculus TaxID=1915356 RepID=A0ABR2HI43_9EUKA
MLKHIILEFDGDSELLEIDDIFQYEGKKDFSRVTALEAIADTTEMSLSFLGDMFPSLQKLRLNNSIIPSVRDISSNFKHLRFLSLAHCHITSLDGISTISDKLEELYLAFNNITDFSELIGMDNLRILDLEENNITNIADVEIFSTCKRLRALTLAGNPAADSDKYRSEVMKYAPQITYLDEKRLRPKVQQSPSKASIPVPPKKELIPSDKIVDKIQKGEKCGIKPRTAEEPKREAAVTEYVEDIIQERPPTSHGMYSKKVTDSWLKPVVKPSNPPKLGNVAPRITRPLSSCRKFRVGHI